MSENMQDKIDISFVVFCNELSLAIKHNLEVNAKIGISFNIYLVI